MPTLNPFKLLVLCLQPSGRFSRAQFALVYLGPMAAFFFAILGIGLASELLGLGQMAVGLLGILALLAFLPVFAITFIGGGIRRWHDLGRSSWYVLLGFLPCVGFVAILYMLLAPGRTDAAAPSGSTPMLAAGAAVLVVGVYGLGIIAYMTLRPFLLLRDAGSQAATGEAGTIEDPPFPRASAAANETMTIADIRTLLSAQTVYGESNGGLYEGNLECLAHPSAGCAPGLPAEVLPFIDPALASQQPRYGYRRRLEPGRTMAVDPAVSSRTSIAGYAYVAVPVSVGQTGKRSFCGDTSGVVCFRSDGADIPAPGGECPVASGGCEPLG